MKAFVLMAGVGVLLLSSCSRNSNSSSQSPTTQSNSATQTAPTPNYGSVLGQAQKYSVGQIDLAQLKQAIQQFDAAEGRYPNDLQELVPDYLAKIPAVPPGYTITYNPTSGSVKVAQP